MLEYGEYVPLRDKFVGFTQISGTGIKEVRECLGVRVDPGIRIYQYNREPRFPMLSIALSKIMGCEPLMRFQADPKLRAKYDHKQRAVFVRAGDPFAECHEVGHAFTHQEKPGLPVRYTESYRDLRKVPDMIALYALDEGIAQWVAIQSGLKNRDPHRAAEAVRESNKLVASPSDSSVLLYDPAILNGRIEQVVQVTAAYCGDLAVQRGFMIEYIKNSYLSTLDTLYKAALALGYVYTASRFEQLSIQWPEMTTPEKLSRIIGDPPKFAQLIHEVTAFRGFTPASL